MLIHRRDCLLGGASLLALSLTGCDEELPTMTIAAGLGLAVTLMLGPEAGVVVSIGSLLFDIVKDASVGFAAHVLEQTVIKLVDGQKPQTVTKGDQIGAATTNDETRRFAYIAAQAQGEDDVLDALKSKTPIWLQSTSLKNYNSFKVLLKNNSTDDCTRGAEGDRAGGQVIIKIFDQDGTEEVSLYTDPFCLEPGAEKLLDYSFVGKFSNPGKRRLEVVSRPAHISVTLSPEFLVVPLQAGDPPGDANAIIANESA
jgi:hypothetical protein